MTAFISNAAARAGLDAQCALVDAGASNGVLRIYSGTVPADASVALTDQVLLAELPMSDPAFAPSVDNNPGALATAFAISEDPSANATGAASFYRVADSDGNVVMQGDVGVKNSGAALEMPTVSIVVEQPVRIDTLTATQSEGSS